jgi:alpha-tubulin suppressor-like RCC1 family protein
VVYALRQDGTVLAWGADTDGQLGQGTSVGISTAVPVLGLTNITKLGVELHMTYALRSDGTVWTWGYNDCGQLGDGTTTSRNTPAPVAGITNVIDVAYGYHAVYALHGDGTVSAWGNNQMGLLGDARYSYHPWPVQVSGLSNITTLESMPGSPSWYFAKASDGTVWTWGHNNYNGEYNVRADGSSAGYTIPGPWPSFSATVIDTASSINSAAGYVLLQDGTVWSMGYNDYGQLGDGNLSHQPEPHGRYYQDYSETFVQVSGLTDIISITAGYRSAYALRRDGTVWAWGSNRLGQLGDGSTSRQTDRYGYDFSPTPVQVSGLTNVTSIVTDAIYDSSTVYALRNDGSVWAWGSNRFGQLGDGSTSHQTDRNGYDFSPTPVPVSGLTNVASLAAAIRSAYALLQDGTVWAWGEGGSGQLGNGSDTTSTTPVQVSGLTAVTSIASSETTAFALRADGTVWAWGYGGYGQLGNGSETASTTPVQVSGLTAVTNLFLAGNTAYALRADGTVWAWGNNDHGQLGDGRSDHYHAWLGTDYSAIPVQVSGLTNIASISTYYSSAFALSQDGTVWAWGYNIHSGQLGDGTVRDKYTPFQLPGLTNIARIFFASAVTFAITN